MMANEFEMSMIGEFSYFLGLQIKKLKNGTFESKAISTPMGTNGNLIVMQVVT
jgi:hypothetical protein